MNPYNTPKIAPTRNDKSLKKYSPPLVVRISINAITLTLSFGIAKMVYLAYFREVFRLNPIGPAIGFVIGISIIIGIAYLLLRGLYRGSKLAFWIVILHALFAVIAFRYSLNQFSRYQSQWEKGLFLFQGIVQLFSAVALLSPRSWRWFHKDKSLAISGHQEEWASFCNSSGKSCLTYRLNSSRGANVRGKK